MFFVLYLIAFIYCANLGVNATFLLVYLYIIVYFSTKMLNINLFHFWRDVLSSIRKEVFLLSV